MTNWNRRDVVLGAGGLAGLGALGTGRALAAAGTPNAADVLRQIRLGGKAEAAFVERLGRGTAPAARLPQPLRPTANVEAEVVAKLDATGSPFAYGLGFTCDPKVLNRLTVNGSPLVARRVCFSADAVNWAPGVGFPVYSAFAPRFDYDVATHYPKAKAHQVVPVVGSSYFTGCGASDVCESPEPGAVMFDVNDTHYEDNVGFYRVTVWSWS